MAQKKYLFSAAKIDPLILMLRDNEGLTFAAIAERLNISVAYANQRYLALTEPATHPPVQSGIWNADLQRALNVLRRKRKSPKQIANALDITVEQVRGRIAFMEMMGNAL